MLIWVSWKASFRFRPSSPFTRGIRLIFVKTNKEHGTVTRILCHDCTDNSHPDHPLIISGLWYHHLRVFLAIYLLIITTIIINDTHYIFIVLIIPMISTIWQCTESSVFLEGTCQDCCGYREISGQKKTVLVSCCREKIIMSYVPFLAQNLCIHHIPSHAAL